MSTTGALKRAPVRVHPPPVYHEFPTFASFARSGGCSVFAV